MPELPEVETVKRGIAPSLTGAKIKKIELSGKNLRYPLPDDYQKSLIDHSITQVDRRAKYLLLHLSSGQTLIFHLGMSGSITFRTTSKLHDHITIHLQNKKGENIIIRYNDPRRFGFSDIIDTSHLLDHKHFKHLGIEPLQQEFTAEYLHQQLNHKKTPIKQAIMDNKIVVGVGNIYASESLFLCGINPLTPCCKISRKKYALLVKMIQKTLNDAIKAGGSSLKDHKTAQNTLGYFQHSFKVYGRENKPCTACNCTIISQNIAGRNTFFCPKCQPI